MGSPFPLVAVDEGVDRGWLPRDVGGGRCFWGLQKPNGRSEDSVMRTGSGSRSRPDADVIAIVCRDLRAVAMGDYRSTA